MRTQTPTHSREIVQKACINICVCLLSIFICTPLALAQVELGAYNPITPEDAQKNGFIQPLAGEKGDTAKGIAIRTKNCPRGAIGCTLFDSSKTATSGLTRTVFAILNTLLQLMAGIAVVMIVIAGFRYAISRGESSEIEAAKKQVIWSLAGLLVITLSLIAVQNLTKILFEAIEVPAAPVSETAVDASPATPALTSGGTTKTGAGTPNLGTGTNNAPTSPTPTITTGKTTPQNAPAPGVTTHGTQTLVKP